MTKGDAGAMRDVWSHEDDVLYLACAVANEAVESTALCP